MGLKLAVKIILPSVPKMMLVVLAALTCFEPEILISRKTAF